MSCVDVLDFMSAKSCLYIFILYFKKITILNFEGWMGTVKVGCVVVKALGYKDVQGKKQKPP